MKLFSWIDNGENLKNICEVCAKETQNTIRVKIEEDGVYHPVRNIYKEYVEKYGYSEYDGSDVLSDWN